jgi:DNA-binding NarL/FixJ family response regulator
LLEQGDREGAQRILPEAAGLATELGHRPLARELQALARRARIPIADTANTDGLEPRYRDFGLTRRELEVLHLLADGRTNRQIAAQLYITEKTTEHHVSRILRKLDVHTRGAAGAIAHRIGREANAPG